MKIRKQQKSLEVLTKKLHDGVAQTLTIACLKLEVLVNSDEINKSSLKEILKNLKSAVKDVSGIVKWLNDKNSYC